MAFGTRLGVLMDRLSTTMREGAEEGEGASRIGTRIFNTTKDTLFTGEKTETDSGATATSRIAGGVIGVGAVAGVGAAAQQAQDHPVLGIGAMGATAALLASRPKTIMDTLSGMGSKLSKFGNIEDAANVVNGMKSGISGAAEEASLPAYKVNSAGKPYNPANGQLLKKGVLGS